MRDQMQTQIDRLVKQFMVQLSTAVAEGLGEVMGEVAPKPPVRAGKLSQPSDNVQTKRSVNVKKRGSAKDDTQQAMIAALRKGESCDAVAKKFGKKVGSIRAVKANLTRGAYD